MLPEELHAYHELALTCAADGDVVECGVYRGASLAAIASALPGRRVWAYDSFEGFPPGNPEYDDAVALGLEGAVVGSPEFVQEAVGHLGELTIVKGWFADTFQQHGPEKIAFLSVDCDLYDSVLLTLRTFANRVQPGGIITLDDWYCFQGCRSAFETWTRETGKTINVETFGVGQGYWVV